MRVSYVKLSSIPVYNERTKIMLVILLTLGVMLVAGLIAIPTAQAVVSRSQLYKQIREQISKCTSGLDGLKERITSQVSQGLHGGRPTG
jgi:predicted PurR-regulated permease PerM